MQLLQLLQLVMVHRLVLTASQYLGRVTASVGPPRLAVPEILLAKRSNSQSVDPRPFSAIPKVQDLPFIGTALDFVKPEVKGKPFLVPLERKQVYGSIYREKPMPTGPEFIVTLNPEDVEKVFCADGKEPHPPNFGICDEARNKAKQEKGLVLS